MYPLTSEKLLAPDGDCITLTLPYDLGSETPGPGPILTCLQPTGTDVLGDWKSVLEDLVTRA